MFVVSVLSYGFNKGVRGCWWLVVNFEGMLFGWWEVKVRCIWLGEMDCIYSLGMMLGGINCLSHHSLTPSHEVVRLCGVFKKLYVM